MIEGPLIQTVILSIVLGSAGIVLSDKFEMPGILFYFAMGIIFGPSVLGLLHPASLGEGLSIMITIFVTIILFEGGLSLNIKQITSLKSVLFKDISLSIIILVPIGFASARYIADLPWEISIIFGSLIIVTGPTVIKPVIRHITLSSKVKNFLNGESVLIDAVGAILVIVILKFILTSHAISLSIAGFAASIMAGTLFGLAFGFMAKYLLNRTSIIPSSANSFFILGSLLLAFVCSELLLPDSGLLTVVVMGLVLSTMEYRSKEKILNFKDQVTRIITSILFVILSANFEIKHISQYLLEGLIIIAIIILARFPIIFLSTAKEDFSAKEKLFMSWLGPRGIIALSVASIAALQLEAAGIEKAYTIEILIFMLISITVLTQGLSAKWVAHKLNILIKGDRSLVILGVNEISLMVAEKWRNNSTDILFVDSNSRNCRIARQKGFLCIEGNALDSLTYTGVEIENFTSALATTDNNEVNVIFCRFLKETYGIGNLYTVLNEKANEELAEIIKEENIKLAFGTRSKEEENFSWDGFLSKLKDVFSTEKQSLKWLKITCSEYAKSTTEKYSLPKGVTIFIVIRNSTERYVYHTSFELRLNDEIFAMGTEEGMRKMQDLLCSNKDMGKEQLMIDSL